MPGKDKAEETEGPRQQKRCLEIGFWVFVLDTACNSQVSGLATSHESFWAQGSGLGVQ